MMKIIQQLKEKRYTESEQQVIDYLLEHLMISLKIVIHQMRPLSVYVIK